MTTSGKAHSGWYRVHDGHVESWDGQTWVSGPVDDVSATDAPDEWKNVSEGFHGYWDGQMWAPDAPTAVKDPSHRRRVRRLWIIVGVIGVGAWVGVTILAARWWDAASVPTPETTIMRTEFAAEPDVPLTNEVGYTWEQHGGQLLLTPTTPGWHKKSWKVGAYEALGVQSYPRPAEGSAAEVRAGVMVTNADGGGVALVCDGAGLPSMFDIESGAALAQGDVGQCFEWEVMTLEVSNTPTGGFFATACPYCGSDYSLDVWGSRDLGLLTNVGIIFAVDEGTTAIHVDGIAAAAAVDDSNR